MIQRWRLASMRAAALLVACSGKPSTEPAATPAISNARKDSCGERAAAMKVFMRELFEDKALPFPPPTGDAVLDREIERRRQLLRDLADPSKPAPALSGEIKPGPIDHELASCPRATEQLVAVGNAWTSPEKLAAWVGIADAIETCECRPRIAYLMPLFYLLARGAD